MLRFFTFFILFCWTVASLGQSVRADQATLYLNEIPVFTLKVSLNGLTPIKRCQAIEKTLRATPPKLPLSIVPQGQNRWIKASGGTVNVVRITPEEASLCGKTVEELVEQWSSSLAAALELPPLTTEVDHIVLAPGEKVFVPVIGSEALQCNAFCDNTAVAVAGSQNGRTYVQAVEVGETELTLKGETGVISIVVTVKPGVSAPPVGLTAEVWGTPADSAQVRQAVGNAIREFYRILPEATLEVLKVDAVTLNVGVTKEVNATIRVSAPNVMPYQGNVKVTVKNGKLKMAKEAALWYCNDPENVLGEGVLYNQSLESNKPVRILYHHINDSGAPLVMQVVLYNTSVLPALVQICNSDGSPQLDPAKVGLDAGIGFLTDYQSSNSQVITIPGRSVAAVAVRPLRAKEVMSGIAYLRLLPQGPEKLVVRCEAHLENPFGLALASHDVVPIIPFTLNPADHPNSNHVYPSPFHELALAYQVGGRQAFARIGQEVEISEDQSVKMYGHYGVIYHIGVDLHNPTGSSSIVEFVYEASAGYGGLALSINGVVQPKAVYQTKETRRVYATRLNPGETRHVDLHLIPVSGGHYPATLVVRNAE